MSGIFNSAIFNNAIFNTGTAGVSAAVTSGVMGRKREVRIHIGDKSRQDTADFLKAQLKLRHPDSAFTETGQDAQASEKARKLLAKQERREKEMRRKADDAAARFARESIQTEEQALKSIAIQNDNMRLLIMIASAV